MENSSIYRRAFRQGEILQSRSTLQAMLDAYLPNHPLDLKLLVQRSTDLDKLLEATLQTASGKSWEWICHILLPDSSS